MLIHGTLSTIQDGEKKENVNRTTVLQTVSSVNVTLLYLDVSQRTLLLRVSCQRNQPAMSVLKLWTLCAVSIEFSGGNIGLLPTKSDVSLCFKETNRIL